MILTRDIRIVDKLIKLCLENPVQLRSRHVAALVDKSKVVSLGMNKVKSDPGMLCLSGDRHRQRVHAEWDCLKNMGDCSKYTMYVVRANRNGELANSKPCPICAKALRQASVDRVVYTVDRGIKEERYTHHT